MMALCVTQAWQFSLVGIKDTSLGGGNCSCLSRFIEYTVSHCVRGRHLLLCYMLRDYKKDEKNLIRLHLTAR